jgi:fructokinase
MTARRAVAVVGEALVDIVHRVYGSVDEAPGGSPANVALTLGRLGQRPQLVTCLGDDRHGQRIRTWLAESGVDVTSVPLARTSTGTAVLDESGAARYSFDLEWSVDAESAEPADVLHTGSIAAVLEPGASRIERLLEERRPTTTITLDLNIRPSLIADAEGTRERIARLVRLADVVKASDEDVAWLHPGRSTDDVADAWLAEGVALALITGGAEGMAGYTTAGRVRRAAARTAVVDTVGAGDTVTGAFIDALIRLVLVGSGRRAALAGMPLELLGRILERCVAAAAITVSRPGADPPRRAELPAFELGVGTASDPSGR